MNENFGDRTTIQKEKSLDRISLEIYKLQKGRASVTGYFEPDDAVTETVLVHPNIGQNSMIQLYPLSAESAAVETKFWEKRSERTQGTCKIHHPSFSDGGLFPFMFEVIG
jgi:hypothetical protein